MNHKLIIISALLFFIGQALVWMQVNGPIIWPIAKTYRWVLMLLGVPITWLFMEATQTAVNAFDGEFWPARFDIATHIDRAADRSPLLTCAQSGRG